MAKREVDINVPDNYTLADVAAALIISGNWDADPYSVYKQLQEQDQESDG